MLLRIYKSTQPIVILLIIFTVAVLWIKPLFYSPFAFAFDDNAMPFYETILRILVFINIRILFPLISFILILVQSYLLIRINNKYRLIDSRTYLPSLFYLLMVSSINPLYIFGPVYFAGIFLLMAIERVLASHKQDIALSHFFDASLLISLGSLFYFHLIYFIFILWIALVLMRTIKWREWMVTIIGALVPYLFVFMVYFMVYNSPAHFFETIKSQYTKSTLTGFKQLSTSYIIFVVYLLFLMIISSYHTFLVFQAKNISTRKYTSLLLWIFFISLIIYALVPGVSLEIFLIVSFSIPYQLSHYFIMTRFKKLASLLFMVLFLLIIYILFFQHIQLL